MLSSNLYRLNRDTTALEVVGERRQLLRVPNGDVIEVLTFRVGPEGRQMARVFWEGRTLEMFAEDVESRGEVILAQTAVR